MANDRKTLADVAAELSRTQATQLDAGCAALLRAGVHPLDLEIVSEICPPQADDGMVVTCRTYVRAGRRRDLETWDDGRRTGDTEGYARALADVCAWLREDPDDWAWLADSIEARFGAKANDDGR